MEHVQNIGDRMRILLHKKRMTQSELAQKIGVSQSAISQMISGKNQPSFELITAISRELDVNCNWLMMGEGPMYKSDSGGGAPKVVSVDADGRPNILLVPAKAQAGYALERLQTGYLSKLPAFHLPLPRLKQGEYRAFEVDGDSMEPTLVQNDVVVCSALDDPRWVRDRFLYVFVLESDVLVKRALKDRARPETLTLVSDNENFLPNECSISEIKEMWRVEARVTFDLPTPPAKPPRTA